LLDHVEAGLFLGIHLKTPKLFSCVQLMLGKILTGGAVKA
jgi:hypothetical protein